MNKTLKNLLKIVVYILIALIVCYGFYTCKKMGV